MYTLRLKFLKHCSTCNSVKPPKSHHCRQCNRCVLRMDHHCPWVGNCVGYKNQKIFILFNLYVNILTIVFFFDMLFRGTICLVTGNFSESTWGINAGPSKGSCRIDNHMDLSAFVEGTAGATSLIYITGFTMIASIFFWLFTVSILT
jgi:ribosomal protein L40E